MSCRQRPSRALRIEERWAAGRRDREAAIDKLEAGGATRGDHGYMFCDGMFCDGRQANA
jgi:hypothetical protein